MVKLSPGTISTFRSCKDLCSSEPAQLRRTIDDLEQQIESNLNFIERQADHIRELERALDFKEGGPVPVPAAGSLEQEIKLEQYSDAFMDLYETEEEYVSEIHGLFKQLPATPQAKELAGRLRAFPGQLRSARIRKHIDPFQAYRELRELSALALRFIWQHPRAAEPMKVEVFRARILLESLKNGVKSLDTQEVIKSLTMVESRRIDRKQALRAMRRAASLEPRARLVQKERRKAVLYLVKEADA